MTTGVFLCALPRQADQPWRDPWLAQRVAVVDQYVLSGQLLDGAQALILTMHQDQRWLAKHTAVLDQFVTAGGTLVVQGQVAYPFLAGLLSRFRPARDLKLADYVIERCRPHPIFEGIKMESLNSRRGVAGFYARGSNPPPAQARVLSTLANGAVPVDWVADHGRGRLFVHSGNDLWTTFAEPEANLDLARRLVAWALDEGIPS